MFYGTASSFVDYHALRNNAIPIDIDTDPEREAALTVASEWIDAKYRRLFEGEKTGGRDQVLEWPRVNHRDFYGYIIASNIIPLEIEKATYEIALRHVVSPGVLSVDYTPSQYSQVSVDGAVSVKYAQFGSAYEIQTQFALVDEILSGLFYRDANGSKLSGSVERQ